MPIEVHRAEAARRARRRWYPPLLLPLALLALPVLWLWTKGGERTTRAGYGLLDPSTVVLALPEEWTDERWSEDLERIVAGAGGIGLDDGPALTALAREIADLSFVAEVAEPRVVWPAGVEFELRLRRPVACVVSGTRFLSVDAEGVLLDGAHPTPPRLGAGHLPVLGPVDDGRFDGLAPGARLADDADLDALSIAVSMWEHLPETALERLGRATIDAREARLATVERPGAVIALEGSRAIAFGRSPREAHPASLPVAAKWEHVDRALADLERESWRVLDARMEESTYSWPEADGSDS